MPKKLFIVLTFLALALAACAQAAQSTEQPYATAVPGAGLPATQTPPPAATAQSVATHEPGCTISSRQATPDPTLEAMLPPPTAEDWTRGPEDAYVTLLEYSDFQ